jgi:hypothetical protein
MSLNTNYTARKGMIHKSEGSHSYRSRQGRADGCWRWGNSFMLSGVSSCYRVELLGWELEEG